MRTIMGFVLAPFPAALVQALFVALWPKVERGGVFAHPASMFVAMCLLFYLLEVTIGIVCVAFMRRRSSLSVINHVCAGLVTIAAPLAVVVLFASARGLPTSAVIYSLAFFTAGGAVAGLVFWAVVGRNVKVHLH